MKSSQKLLVLLVYVAWIAGFFYGNDMTATDLVERVPFWQMMLALVISVYTTYFHVIFHEFGHLVFGKMTGYQLLMFQGPWFRYEAKTKTFSAKKPQVVGFLGQCLKAPPEKGTYQEKPYFLYLAGGLIINLLTAILFYVGSFVLTGELSFFSLLFSLPALWMFLANVLPYGSNDGRMIREIKKADVTKKLFFQQLQLAPMFEEGTLFTDIPEEYLEEVYNGQAKTSFLGEYIYMVAYQKELAKLNFPSADGLMQDYLATWDYMKSPYARNVANEKLFCDAIFGRKDKARQTFETIQKYPLLKNQYDSSPVIQTAYLLFVEMDIEKAKEAIKAKPLANRGEYNKSEQTLQKQMTEWLNGFLI